MSLSEFTTINLANSKKGVKKSLMPDQRAAGKSLVGCYVDESFAAEIDRARGGKSRSDFLREVLFNYLEKAGFTLKDEWKFAPDRAGKGGRPKKAVARITLTSIEGGGGKTAETA